MTSNASSLTSSDAIDRVQRATTILREIAARVDAEEKAHLDKPIDLGLDQAADAQGYDAAEHQTKKAPNCLQAVVGQE